MASRNFKAIDKKGDPRAAGNNSYDKMIRIIRAVNNREKIIVYGNGNREGICSIALLILVLRYFNADFDYFLIPQKGNRETLISDVKTHLNFYSPGVILSLEDNFTETVQDVLIQANTDLIAIDRWGNLKKENPSEPDSLIKTVFLFAKDLSKNYDTENIYRYIDLVYLGADEKNLGDDVLIKLGLERLNISTNYGIKALMKNRESKNSDIRTMIKPKDNPWSMVDNARIIIELLTTEDLHRAEQIAKYLRNS